MQEALADAELHPEFEGGIDPATLSAVEIPRLAEYYAAKLSHISMDKDGYREPRALRAWLQEAAEVAIGFGHPHGTDSYDSTVEMIFADGSTLTVDNPRQHAFACNWRAL
jgi:hypothetical protein